MPASSGQWKEVVSTNKPLKRHEHAYAKVHEMFYLIGGRRVQPVQAYDPATKTWKNLGKPPIERHHFQTVTVDEKEQWFTLASPQGDLPDPRAGTASLTLGKEVLVIGGEIAQKLAHSSVDALDVKTGVWRSLPPLLQGRHLPTRLA